MPFRIFFRCRREENIFAAFFEHAELDIHFRYAIFAAIFSASFRADRPMFSYFFVSFQLAFQLE
jgi:hypothetical protein